MGLSPWVKEVQALTCGCCSTPANEATMVVSGGYLDADEYCITGGICGTTGVGFQLLLVYLRTTWTLKLP